MNFLIAGRDTTALGTAWTLYELLKHPQILSALREELDAARREHSHASPPDAAPDELVSYETLSQLPFLDAVVHEGLRLHPPIARDIKIAAADDVLPTGYFIPKGSWVLYHPYGMGRDVATWGYDADHFRPERWLTMQRRPTAYEWPVFNAGPRVCLGQRMALLEIKVALVHLLTQLELTPCEGLEGIGYIESLTKGFDRPFWVHAERRGE